MHSVQLNRKYNSLSSWVIILTLNSTQNFAMTTNNTDLTQKINTVIQKYFDPQKINDIYNKKIISDKTAQSFTEISQRTTDLLSACDATFQDTPGYFGLKWKLYQHLKNFALSLGLPKEEIDNQKIIDDRQAGNLRRDLAGYLNSIDEELRKTGLSKENFKNMAITKTVQLLSSDKSPTSAKSPKTKKSIKTKRGSLLQPKLEYLKNLFLLHKNGEDVSKFEKSELGLTLTDAYKYELLNKNIFDTPSDEKKYNENIEILRERLKNETEFEKFKKTLPIEIKKSQGRSISVVSKQPATESYDRKADNINGTLYELEGALIAQKIKGERVLFLGPIMTLSLEGDTLEEAKKLPYFNVNEQESLEQEFDIVTSESLIETKQLEVDPYDYKETLERQRKMSQLCQDTASATISVPLSDAILNSSDFKNKKILFYVKKLKQSQSVMDEAQKKFAQDDFTMIETTNEDLKKAIFEATHPTKNLSTRKSKRLSPEDPSGASTDQNISSPEHKEKKPAQQETPIIDMDYLTLRSPSSHQKRGPKGVTQPAKRKTPQKLNFDSSDGK